MWSALVNLTDEELRSDEVRDRVIAFTGPGDKFTFLAYVTMGWYEEARNFAKSICTS